MESLVKCQDDSNETFSVFMRNRAGSAGSDRTSSAPSSPTKLVKSPDFSPGTPEPESPRVKSPKANFSSPEGSVSSTKNEANKQSCDPILEVDEEDRPLRRRTSLQQDPKQLNLLRKKEVTPPVSALATPPR